MGLELRPCFPWGGSKEGRLTPQVVPWLHHAKAKPQLRSGPVSRQTQLSLRKWLWPGTQSGWPGALQDLELAGTKAHQAPCSEPLSRLHQLPSSQCLLQMKLVLFINKNLFSPFPLPLRQFHLEAQAILELMSLVAILLSQDLNTKIIKVTTLNKNFF